MSHCVSDTNQFGKVAVLMGGSSAEREISLLSGQAVLTALQKSGVNAHAFDPAQTPIWQLKEQGFDRAFIILHGRGGEDGLIQGALEILGIPYTGSGVMASALSMDKWRTKMIWAAAGLPTPRYCLLNAQSDWQAITKELGLPLFVKPVREGSSMGASKVISVEGLSLAYQLAAEYDNLILAEEFVTGEELTVAFLGDQVLPSVRIVAPEGKYDYQNKYFGDQTQYFCPSGLDTAKENEITQLVLRAARLLSCTGWGRVDLMLRWDGQPYLLEMNTLPGMTGHSLVPMAAQAAGLSFEQLCLTILEQASIGKTE